LKGQGPLSDVPDRHRDHIWGRFHISRGVTAARRARRLL